MGHIILYSTDREGTENRRFRARSSFVQHAERALRSRCMYDEIIIKKNIVSVEECANKEMKTQKTPVIQKKNKHV